MSKLPHYALRFVGGTAAVFAGLGFWYNGTTLFASIPIDPRTPYFSHAFYTMSAVCLSCYLTLLVIGIQFVRLKTSLVRLFVGVMIFEVVYFFSVSILWVVPGIGRSVAAATGVANAGLMLQFLVLFPLWGPLLAHWARNYKEASPSGSEVFYFASEQVERPSDYAWAVLQSVVIFVITSFLIVMVWPRVGRSSVPPFPVILGLPALLGVANAFASVNGRRKRRRRRIEHRHASRLKMGHCPRCEYNLRGLTENRCPECGQSVAVLPTHPE